MTLSLRLDIGKARRLARLRPRRRVRRRSDAHLSGPVAGTRARRGRIVTLPPTLDATPSPAPVRSVVSVVAYSERPGLLRRSLALGARGGCAVVRRVDDSRARSMLGPTGPGVDARRGVSKRKRLRAAPAQWRCVGRLRPVRGDAVRAGDPLHLRPRARRDPVRDACALRDRNARLGRALEGAPLVCRHRSAGHEPVAHLHRGAGWRHPAPGGRGRRRASGRLSGGAADGSRQGARSGVDRGRLGPPRSRGRSSAGGRYRGPHGPGLRRRAGRAIGGGSGRDSGRGTGWTGDPAPGACAPLIERSPKGRIGRSLGQVLAYVRDPRAPRAIAMAAALGVVVAVVQFVVIRGIVFAVGAVPTEEKWIYVGTAMAFIVSIIPALPGAWGTADATYVFFFGLAGVGSGAALAVCLIFRLFWYLSGLVGALLRVVRWELREFDARPRVLLTARRAGRLRRAQERAVISGCDERDDGQ